MENNDDMNIPAFLKRDKNWKPEPRVLTPVEEKLVIKSVLDSGKTIEVLENPTGPSTKEKIVRGMREAASELITEINEHHDSFILHDTGFNAYEFMRAREVKPAIAKSVIDKFQPQLDELVASKTDPELKAAYATIDVKANIKFLTAIIDDTQRWIDNQKVGKVRKTRVMKIRPEKKVKSLKYQKEDRELKLISIAPERIIGAQELWTYNTKYKHLTRYVARGRAGFMVKGTTLQDFDVDNSATKVLRKPTEVINEVLKSGKKKILDGLKTKVIVPTGRINENTILLKVS